MTKITYTIDTETQPYEYQAINQAVNMLGALIELDRTLRNYTKYKEENKNTPGMLLARKVLYGILKDYNVNIHE